MPDKNDTERSEPENVEALATTPCYVPTNREKARTAKRTKFWCMSCDQQLVSLTKKCPVCGSRQNRKKIINT